MTMKRLFLLLATVALPASLTGQEVVMKNGSRFPLKDPRRQGDMLFLAITAPGGGGSAVVGYRVSDIEKVEMPSASALLPARNLLFLGKPAEALTAAKPAFEAIGPLRGIPGSGWEEAALLYAAALQSCGQIPEAVAILDQFEVNSPKGSAAREIARVRLAALKYSQETRKVLGVVDQALAAKLGAGVAAEAHTVAGDALLINKSFEEALTRYLKVVIFCPSDRWLGARSLLGSAKAMASLNEKKNCVRALREIINSYPGSPQADAATKMMAAGGNPYTLLLTELDEDEATAKERLKDASSSPPN